MKLCAISQLGYFFLEVHINITTCKATACVIYCFNGCSSLIRLIRLINCRKVTGKLSTHSYAVSYTHLDVYKRQPMGCAGCIVFKAAICVMQSEKFRAKREMLAQIIKSIFWSLASRIMRLNASRFRSEVPDFPSSL